jgi:ABC-type transport system involved in multi-copper enzyme maturation permease subunit
MKQLIGAEFKKIIASKYARLILIILFTSMVVPYIFLYFVGNNNFNMIEYVYNMLALNNKIMFPLTAVMFFSWIVTHEYKLKTIKHIFNSIYSREEILLSKILMGLFLFLHHSLPFL